MLNSVSNPPSLVSFSAAITSIGVFFLQLLSVQISDIFAQDIGIRIQSSKNVRGEQEKEEIVVRGLPMGQEAGLENLGEEARKR